MRGKGGGKMIDRGQGRGVLKREREREEEA